MGVDAGSVYSSIRIRLTDLDNDLKGVYARLGQLEQNITKSTTTGNTGFKNMFAAVLSGQAVLALAQKGFQALTGFIKDSTEVARDSQEMISKYNVVFSGMGDASEEAAKKFSDSFDLAGATAKEMLGNTGNLLQGMGATREESLALSLEVNTLAADLASFTNNQGGSKAASEALTKALLGEKESMKSLGIAILDSDVTARVAKNGQSELTGTALKLAKAQATLQLITEQSKNAIGDYARTQDSAANTQKRAEESTKKLQIAIGTALNPAATLMAGIWAKVSGSLAEVITKQNELSAARSASDKGIATNEQRILLLKEEIKNGEDLLKQYGETRESAKKSNNDVVKSIAEQISMTELRIGGIQRVQQTQALADRTKAEADEKAAAKAKAAADLDQKYVDQRKKVTEILSENKTEYQKIQDEIDSINLAWSQGTVLEKDRAKAIALLQAKQKEITDAEQAANQSVIDSVATLTDAKASELDIAESSAIKQIQDSKLLVSEKEALIAKVKEYYSTLKDKKATDDFVKSINDALSLSSQAMSAYFSLVTQLNKNTQEEQEKALEEETESLSDELEDRQQLEQYSLDARYEALTEYLDARQEAEQEALDARYESLTEALDAELQAELYKNGLAEADTVAQFQAELDAAIATGDAETIATAQNALLEAQIKQKYADEQKALEEKQAADSKALEEKQAAESKALAVQEAADTKALEEKQAAEKLALEEQQARKLADIQYKANLAQWQMQLALSTVTVAQSVIQAYNSQLALPIIGPISGAAAAGVAATLGAVQLAAIIAAKPVPSYATGGIVPGTSYTGDNVQANVNSGEMILNRDQQSSLFDMINGGTSGSMNATIVVQLDSKTIAQSTVALVNNGEYFIKARSVVK